jgi:hypothetical protein
MKVSFSIFEFRHLKSVWIILGNSKNTGASSSASPSAHLRAPISRDRSPPAVAVASSSCRRPTTLPPSMLGQCPPALLKSVEEHPKPLFPFPLVLASSLCSTSSLPPGNLTSVSRPVRPRAAATSLDSPLSFWAGFGRGYFLPRRCCKPPPPPNLRLPGVELSRARHCLPPAD